MEWITYIKGRIRRGFTLPRFNPAVIVVNPGRFIKKNRYLCVYLLGVVAGSFLLNFFRTRGFAAQIDSYGNYVYSSLESTNIDRISFFMTVIATRFRESLICIVMTFTPFAKIFAMVWCCKYGISLGVALSLAVSCYGSIGLWIFFMSVFPYVIALTLLTIIQVKMLDEKAKSYAFLMAVTLGEVLIESFM